MRCPRGRDCLQRLTSGVSKQVDLGAQTAAGPALSLVVTGVGSFALAAIPGAEGKIDQVPAVAEDG